MMSYKLWVILAVILFGLGLAVGISSPAGAAALSTDVASLQKLSEFLATLPLPAVFVVILFKNVLALLFSFGLSPFLCLVPILALVTNGWLIGLVSNTVLGEKSVTYLLAGLLPHGIFEIPAFIMGEAVALSFGVSMIVYLFKKNSREMLMANFRRNFRYFVIALILLIPAAIMETFVTPLVLKRFG